MDVIADVIRSNNYIPADKGLSLNVCAITNIQGLNRVSINSEWEDLIWKSCIIPVENDDNLCLPRAIGIALTRCKHMENPSNVLLKRHYDSIRKKDRKRMHKYNAISLQKQVAVQLEKLIYPTIRKVCLLTSPYMRKVYMWELLWFQREVPVRKYTTVTSHILLK